jgi:glycogen phosphorylase
MDGVHMPSWDSAAADDLWTEACGKERWLGTTEPLEQDIRRLSNARLWQFRADASTSLVDYVCERLTLQRGASGALPEAVDEAKHLLNPNALTLGFARRFATYKRPNLLLHDPERLIKLLTNPQYPVQLIIAGKAHPADQSGQDMIQRWVRFTRRPEVRQHVVFLSDYDMLLTEQLVQGVDVWLNTPRRPWEASGTSGMKMLVNGGINLSELDGWWAEAYSPDVGWALGDGQEHGDDPSWDIAEAEEIYMLLEQQVIPEFYNRDQNGIPVAWVARMRESMARLTPQFSANRSVREYTEHYYIPAAEAYLERAAGQGSAGVQFVNWQHILQDNWGNLHFGDVTVATSGEWHLFEAQVYLGGIDPDAVHVELYAEESDGEHSARLEMYRERQLVGAENGYIFKVQVPATRPSGDFTARIVPYRQGVAIPLEDTHIVWQR